MDAITFCRPGRPYYRIQVRDAAEAPGMAEEVEMALFVTIGYGDREGYDRTPLEVRAAADNHDAHLQDQGAVMGIAGSPVQVRNHGGVNVSMTQGPFMSAELPVAGFALIEAASLADAMEMVSRTPCAVAEGVVEVWPLNQ